LIKKIDKSIASNFEYVEKLRSTIQHESDRIKEIDEQFGELVADDRSEGIVQEFKTHQRKIEENTEKLAHVEKDLEIKRGQLKKEKTAESALSDGRLNPVIAAAQEIWSDIAAISKATRDDVFEKLIAELEGSANSIFQKMTAENASITGRLKLKMLSSDSCVPEIIGKDGSTMVGSNDSNIILIKLALIMAVVTSRARWSQNYSLISDAPTSKMASKYSHGFYRALGENFEQSIVMTYDFLTESERSNLASFRVGKVYRIYANYPGGDREDRTDLDIEISEVSL
jgi:DNA sulfur modification protein DndD